MQDGLFSKAKLQACREGYDIDALLEIIRLLPPTRQDKAVILREKNYLISIVSILSVLVEKVLHVLQTYDADSNRLAIKAVEHMKARLWDRSFNFSVELPIAIRIAEDTLRYLNAWIDNYVHVLPDELWELNKCVQRDMTVKNPCLHPLLKAVQSVYNELSTIARQKLAIAAVLHACENATLTNADVSDVLALAKDAQQLIDGGVSYNEDVVGRWVPGASQQNITEARERVAAAAARKPAATMASTFGQQTVRAPRTGFRIGFGNRGGRLHAIRRVSPKPSETWFADEDGPWTSDTPAGAGASASAAAAAMLPFSSNDRVRCSAITKKGEQCRNVACTTRHGVPVCNVHK